MVFCVLNSRLLNDFDSALKKINISDFDLYSQIIKQKKVLSNIAQ